VEEREGEPVLVGDDVPAVEEVAAVLPRPWEGVVGSEVRAAWAPVHAEEQVEVEGQSQTKPERLSATVVVQGAIGRTVRSWTTEQQSRGARRLMRSSGDDCQ
jgi:hypothetical protein